MNRRGLVIGVAVIVAAVAVTLWRSGAFAPAPAGAIAVTVPALSAVAMEGAALFAENCAACHGPNGAGSEVGPPLIHKTYEPGHHGDAAFHLAALRGVRSHHWQFGDMPPVEGVTDADVGKIVAFVREVQRANGID